MAAIDVVSADDTESGQELASSLLAQAFADDPVIRWVQPDRSTDRAFHRATLRWAHPHGVVDVAMRDGVGVGAAIWDPPGATLSGVETARMAAAFTRVLGSAFVRGAIVDKMCDERRPDEPHWYLAELGAAVQGMGVGTTLLRAGVDRADGLAYLESSNEINVPLYERFGFVVTGEIHLPRGGPTLWTMERRG